MSEPILRVLIRLFALICDPHSDEVISSRGKDIVRLFLSRHLNNELVIRYMEMFDEYLSLYHSEEIVKGSVKERKRTSLTAMRILAICEKINEELHQKQKVYVMVQLMDFILFSAEVTEKELDFLDTVSAAFNITDSDYQNVKSFILSSVNDIPEKNRVMIIDDKDECDIERLKHLYTENLRGVITFLHIASTNTFFLRYTGRVDIFLNGQNVLPGHTYTFDHGSTIRASGINTLYYNDISTVFIEEAFKLKVSIDAIDISLRFKNSENGIHKLSFHEESGNLVGIMGGSGVGKSTLLNVLSGITVPQKGKVSINGYNLYSDHDKSNLNGVIGFVPQDDLLIEELTVYQNLHFSARLCLDNLSDSKLTEAVNKTLTDLDLMEIRDLKVGSPLNKIISGGQRKRLNIALELIREPTILFVDEPTSGLSSVDSEIVMNLLKEQTYRGKLVIINIHQPGSDIYKMFDKIMVIDRGGYQIFYGNPTEAIVYFKTKSSYANADEDRCISCGNVDPDQLLQIIEAKVVNEFGKPTHIRKVSPEEWVERLQEEANDNKPKTLKENQELPENYYSIPGLLKQTKIFFMRDVLSKLADRQYVLVSLLVGPLLAFLLAWFTKYSAGEEYLFSENENLPSYLFMCVITSLFLGLIISAEEIFRDRKILKRESFLNLSWFSYLNSKVMILFIISSIQTLFFILIGNTVLEIKGMFFSYWIILFSTSCVANLLGLNISSAVNSVKTIYILIPIILIPQLLFSGVLVKFDRLNRSNLSSHEFVPLVGEMMPARWSFEALAVEQFKNNKFERPFFKYDMGISQTDWYASFLLPALKTKVDECLAAGKEEDYKRYTEQNFGKITYHLSELSELSGIKPGKWIDKINWDEFNTSVAEQAIIFIDSLRTSFRLKNRAITYQKDSLYGELSGKMGKEEFFKRSANNYNENLVNIVKNSLTTNKIYDSDTKLIQKADPVFMTPGSKYGRAQFYAPYKQIWNVKIDTLWFNVLILWIFTFVLYTALYYNLLQKAINFFFLSGISTSKTDTPKTA